MKDLQIAKRLGIAPWELDEAPAMWVNRTWIVMVGESEAQADHYRVATGKGGNRR